MATSSEVKYFTDADVEKLLKEERGEGEEGGWTLCKRTDMAEVWRKQIPGVPVHLVKGFLLFPGIPYRAVVDLVKDYKRRPEWDKLFIVVNKLEEKEDHNLVYWRCKMPVGVVDRSLVQRIKHIDDWENSTHYVLYKNCQEQHPDIPSDSDTVRAETVFSGIVIRPDADQPNSARMSLLFQTDMKGWIPTFLVNIVSRHAPGTWRDSLAEYYENVYSRNGPE